MLGEWRSWGDEWKDTGDNTGLGGWEMQNGRVVVGNGGLNNIARGDMANRAVYLLMNLNCEEIIVLPVMPMKDVAEWVGNGKGLPPYTLISRLESAVNDVGHWKCQAVWNEKEML